jgi:hypothetical protein
MKCSRTGCERDAVVALMLNVPAKDCPIPEHEPIQIVINLQMCEGCLSEAKAADFLTKDLEHVVKIAAKGMQPPDFGRAFVTGIPLDDPKMKMFARKL